MRKESEETTHYSIADQYGNIISNTYTLNSAFGSGVTIEGTGILMNNEMDDFSASPGTPNQFGLLGGEANKIVPENKNQTLIALPTGIPSYVDVLLDQLFHNSEIFLCSTRFELFRLYSPHVLFGMNCPCCLSFLHKRIHSYHFSGLRLSLAHKSRPTILYPINQVISCSASGRRQTNNARNSKSRRTRKSSKER